MSEEKFIGYLRLVEACQASGCPVCRCVIQESRSHLAAILREHVTDPDTRRAVRASWGFCGWHTGMLPEIEHAIFGAAIIYEDLLRRALEQTAGLAVGERRPRRHRWLSALRLRPRQPGAAELYEGRPPCPACVTAAAAERGYLEALVRFIEDGDLHAAYTRSDGLCVPHLLTAVDVGGPRSGVPALVARTREKWRRLGDELGAFVAKHDYRNREPYTAAEAVASTRAFDTLAGARGVFGNDVQGRRRT
jgi:hypothetical protein